MRTFAACDTISILKALFFVVDLSVSIEYFEIGACGFISRVGLSFIIFFWYLSYVVFVVIVVVGIGVVFGIFFVIFVIVVVFSVFRSV